MSVVLTENAVMKKELPRHCEEQSDEAIQFFPG